ncbi:MAG: hypothetical protein ACOVP1_09860 [Bacteroidia bacterium]
MTDVFCVALIFPRSSYRFRTYAMQYAKALLEMNKMVWIYSPDWLLVNEYLLKNFPHKAGFFRCFPSEGAESHGETLGLTGASLHWFGLSRRLKQTEKMMETKIDLVFFCPVDEWISPASGKSILQNLFPYNWTGLFLNTAHLYQEKLKLNVDPSKGEPDYLFLAENCVGAAILDRFKSQELKGRIYKKVVVMPDITDWSLNREGNKLAGQIKAMAGNRIVIGTILLENEEASGFFEMAANAPSDKYFFVCTGEMENAARNKVSRSALQKLIIEKHENNFISPMKLEDSTQVNGLVQSFDICYLNESGNFLPPNLLTKAAYFHKPVISHKNRPEGKLVEIFKTGLTVGPYLQDNLEALEILSKQVPQITSGMENYAKLQDIDSLKESLEQLMWF